VTKLKLIKKKFNSSSHSFSDKYAFRWHPNYLSNDCKIVCISYNKKWRLSQATQAHMTIYRQMNAKAADMKQFNISASNRW